MAKFFFHLRATLRLAVPVILSQLAQTMLGLTDTLMVGRLGETPLAAVALGNTVFFLVLFGGNGLMSAVAPMAAQAYGAQDHTTPARAARQALWLALGISLPVMALLFLAGDLFVHLGQPPEVSALAEGYLDMMAWGFFPALGFSALRGLVEAVEKPVVIAVMGVVGIGANAGLNAVLMYGYFGLPEMGVAGTGLSSTLIFVLAFVVLALYVGFSPATRDMGVFRSLRTPDPEVMRELIVIGWPIAAAWLLEAGMFSATAYLQGFFGATALAAHQVALQSAVFMFNVPLGIGIATSVRVGHEVGREDPSAVAWAAWIGVGCSLVFMTMSATAFLLFPRSLIALYVEIDAPANADVVAQAVLMLGVAALFQIFDGLQVTASGALRGLKDTRGPMVIGGISYWIVGMSTAVVLAFVLDVGPVGLWWGLVSGLGVASVLLCWRLHRKLRRHAAR